MLWHVVITRFSYRHTAVRAGSNGVLVSVLKRDPLLPERLKFRFAVFEITCLPSLLAQTNQDFDWILIVDRDMPPVLRAQLANAVHVRQRTHIHEYDPAQDFTSAEWLQPYAPPDCEQLISTILDDDDALPANYIRSMQAEVRQRMASLAPIATIASRKCMQWELVSTKRAPLGYRCSWHRGGWVLSTGLSLLCRLRPHGLTVLALHHQIADLWMSPERGDALMRLLEERWGLTGPRAIEATAFISGRIDDFKTRAERALQSGGSDVSLCASSEWFLDITDVTDAFVVTNHFLNDQVLRLFEPKPDRTEVTGLASFPGLQVDTAHAIARAALFKKSLRVYVQLTREVLSRKALPWKARLRLAMWASWRFLRA